MIRFRLIVLPALVAAGLTTTTPPAAAERGDDHGLGALVQQRLRAGSSFFTAEEQTVIRSACGYGEGDWDGYEIRFDDDVLICENGRRVDSPDVRRVMRDAGPRIASRVGAVMGSPEVRERINRITSEATARAMREVASHRQDYARIARDATERARRELDRHQHDYARIAREATERAMRALDRLEEREDIRDRD